MVTKMKQTNKTSNRKGILNQLYYLVGWIGYYIAREGINDFRCKQIQLSDKANDICFNIIMWLDKKESVRYWKKRDRGG